MSRRKVHYGVRIVVPAERRKMVSWDFTIRRPDGSVRVESFYAHSRDEAAQLARGWTRRMGFEIEEADEETAA